MGPSRKIMLAMLMSAGCLAVALWWGAAMCPAQKPPGRGNLCLAINTFERQFSPGEPVALMAALGNASTRPAYIGELGHGVRVTDAQGRAVRRSRPIDEPTPPPPDYHMRVDGMWVFVEPIQELKGQDATVAFIADALADYQPLSPGTYTVVVLAAITTFSRDSILQREGHLPPTWARPESATPRFNLESNPLRIEVKE